MRTVLLALILVSLLPGMARGESPNDCYQQRDLDLSIRGCTLVINKVTLTPRERSNAADWRCWAYYLKGDYDRALADCNLAIELRPEFFEAIRDRCAIYNSKEQYDLAIKDCNKALELRSDDAIAYYGRCRAYFDKGDNDRALADCNKAIELKDDLDLSAAFNERCRIYSVKERYDLAISDCSKAIELTPKDGYPYWNRGDAHQKKGEYAAALADLKKAEGLVSQSHTANRSRIREQIREVEAKLSGAPTASVQSTTSKADGSAELQDTSLSPDERRAIQQQLATLGLYSSAIDGDFGPGTRKAIRAFQRANNLEETGYINQAIISLLSVRAAAREQELVAEQNTAAAAATPQVTQPAQPQEPQLSRDERRAIQQQLKTLGLYAYLMDGNFDYPTRTAIRAFQRDNDLDSTGYVDTAMIALLKTKAAARERELAAQQEVAAASSATLSYESWNTVTLCTQALAASKSDWDKDERFAATVREAKRRGLDVGDCRVAIGLPREAILPTAPTEPPPNDFGTVIATLQPIDDVFVAVRPAKVRAAPNVAAKATETLAINDRIEVLGRLPGQDWYLVARDGNPIGYVVMSQLVSEVDYAKAQAAATTDADASLPAEQPIALPPKLAALDYGNYHALVIGNSGYRQLPKLQTPIDDAKAVAALLERGYGFTVSLIADGTEKTIIAELSKLRRTLTAEDNLLIYYAGHGWYDEGAERGYWLPVDAAQDEQSHWISNADITDALKAMRAKQILVVADSCYSGSLTRGLAIRSDNSIYIADIVGRRARTVLTSGGLEPVLDAGGGGHSVFAKAFLNALQANVGVIDGEAIYHQVYEEVRLNAEQEPDYGNIRLAGHDGGDFLFVRKQ